MFDFNTIFIGKHLILYVQLIHECVCYCLSWNILMFMRGGNMSGKIDIVRNSSGLIASITAAQNYTFEIGVKLRWESDENAERRMAADTHTHTTSATHCGKSNASAGDVNASIRKKCLLSKGIMSSHLVYHICVSAYNSFGFFVLLLHKIAN